jgi:hypothetical protein
MKAVMIRWTCDGPTCEETADVPEEPNPGFIIRPPGGWAELRDPDPRKLARRDGPHEQGPLFHSAKCWLEYAAELAQRMWPAPETTVVPTAEEPSSGATVEEEREYPCAGKMVPGCFRSGIHGHYRVRTREADSDNWGPWIEPRLTLGDPAELEPVDIPF